MRENAVRDHTQTLCCFKVFVFHPRPCRVQEERLPVVLAISSIRSLQAEVEKHSSATMIPEDECVCPIWCRVSCQQLLSELLHCSRSCWKQAFLPLDVEGPQRSSCQGESKKPHSGIRTWPTVCLKRRGSRHAKCMILVRRSNGSCASSLKAKDEDFPSARLDYAQNPPSTTAASLHRLGKILGSSRDDRTYDRAHERRVAPAR